MSIVCTIVGLEISKFCAFICVEGAYRRLSEVFNVWIFGTIPRLLVCAVAIALHDGICESLPGQRRGRGMELKVFICDFGKIRGFPRTGTPWPRLDLLGQDMVFKVLINQSGSNDRWKTVGLVPMTVLVGHPTEDDYTRATRCSRCSRCSSVFPERFGGFPRTGAPRPRLDPLGQDKALKVLIN